MRHWPISCTRPGLRAAALYLISLGAVVSAVRAAPPRKPNDRPNVVLMFIDNVGYGDLGCYGNRDVLTPRIDRLAEEGVLCTDFYIGSPSCMPSRGALLTGRHPVRNGLNEQLYKIDELQQIGLPHRERLLPQLLKDRGYATACFGKWNLGFAPGSRPTERGFDEYFGNISGNCDYYTHVYNGRNDLYRGTRPVAADGYSTDLFADAACDFIDRHAAEPFFVYLPFNAAHYPNPKNKPPGGPAIWQAPPQYFARYGYRPHDLDETKRYRAVLTALDNAIGRVLDKIEHAELAPHTIVIVLSDNGAFMIPGRGLECASNRPLKGGGTTVYEGGIRVPCVVRWPEHFPAGSICREPLVSMDLFVMAAVVAGSSLPDDRVLDGRNPIAALAGEASSPHEHLYFHYGGGTAIRRGRYKLMRQGGSQPWCLYDLKSDIGETKNLLAEMPHVGEELMQELDRRMAEAAP